MHRSSYHILRLSEPSIQPLDVSFMKPLMTYYTQKVEKWFRNHPGRVVTTFQSAGLFSGAYDSDFAVSEPTDIPAPQPDDSTDEENELNHISPVNITTVHPPTSVSGQRQGHVPPFHTTTVQPSTSGSEQRKGSVPPVHTTTVQPSTSGSGQRKGHVPPVHTTTVQPSTSESGQRRGARFRPLSLSTIIGNGSSSSFPGTRPIDYEMEMSQSNSDPSIHDNIPENLIDSDTDSLLQLQSTNLELDIDTDSEPEFERRTCYLNSINSDPDQYSIDSNSEFDSVDCDKDLDFSLVNWLSKNNICHNAVRERLESLRPSHPSLPKDPRTLLGTKIDNNVVPNAGGFYYHFGLGNCINIDGLPLFKTSCTQFWPILGRIVSPVLSYSFIIGLYSGQQKPNDVNEYLKEFVEEVIGCKMMVKGHGGYFGCDKYVQKGARINHRMTYPEIDANLRTDAQFHNMSNADHHLGPSPFRNFKNLGMVSQFPLDYMNLHLPREFLRKGRSLHEIPYAHELLCIFVSDFAKLYGNDKIVYNVHGLLHLSKDVEKFGPLDNYSAFNFESFLGRLKRLVRKPNYPIQQVIRRLSENCIQSSNTFLPSNGICKKEHYDGQTPEIARDFLQFKELHLPTIFFIVVKMETAAQFHAFIRTFGDILEDDRIIIMPPRIPNAEGQKNKKKRRRRRVPVNETLAAAQKELVALKKINNNLQRENECLHAIITEDKDNESKTISVKKDMKTYSTGYRKAAYSCILKKVPVESTATVMATVVKEVTELTVKENADATTVSQFAYELSVLNDIQLGLANRCTAADYTNHICQSFTDIATTYAAYSGDDFVPLHKSVVGKLTSTISDRVVDQLKALDILGKLLTGPWMTITYGNQDKMSNLEAVTHLKKCVDALKYFKEHPHAVLDTKEDMFGQELCPDRDPFLAITFSDDDCVHAEKHYKMSTDFKSIRKAHTKNVLTPERSSYHYILSLQFFGQIFLDVTARDSRLFTCLEKILEEQKEILGRLVAQQGIGQSTKDLDETILLSEISRPIKSLDNMTEVEAVLEDTSILFKLVGYLSLILVYRANPIEGERFYLRLLLHHVTGCTSFQDVRTLSNGTLCPTFKEAAIQRGLLSDDSEWTHCLQEAASSAAPSQLSFCFWV
ncbi:hypothetical protein GQR58_020325 [Nymphon striatum]|nr:hypothetical protein GQR58_020325 [Nymphon striatum]